MSASAKPPDAPTFLDLPDAGDEAGIALVCAPYDGTSTYGKGADRGPEALLAASGAVETWDEETGRDLESQRYTVWRPTDEAAFGKQSPEAMVAQLGDVHADFIRRGMHTLGIGGEHSITYGQFAALKAKHENLAVVQIDAHLDLRDSYQGSRHSHASIAARFLEDGAELVQVGMRSCSREEAALVRERGLSVYWARETAGRTAYHREILACLVERPVFVTVDLDGFDPSLVPATGTPEPGGLSWFDVTRLLATIARHCDVVGADITELAPTGEAGSRPSEFLAARLAAKMVAYFWIKDAAPTSVD
ncbi:MAG: agmatinase [Planctomycetota bacterium]|jgi:agmatinase